LAEHLAATARRSWTNGKLPAACLHLAGDLGSTHDHVSTGAIAGQVVLHGGPRQPITTDVNDVSFVKAGRAHRHRTRDLLDHRSGAIVAVDSGSMTQEKFRGNTRNASGNLAFAIVQATGDGHPRGRASLGPTAPSSAPGGLPSP